MPLSPFRLMTLLYLFLSFQSYGQDNTIKFPNNNYDEHCGDCQQLILKKPAEVHMGVHLDWNGEMVFVINNSEWLEKLIPKYRDGIAVEIVSRERYDCSEILPKEHDILRGEVQKVYYKKELEANRDLAYDGSTIIKLGELPEKYRDKEIEFNLAIIRNNYFCYQFTTYNLNSYRWNLLDMGFYLDSLVYGSSFDTFLSAQEKYIIQNKVLKFEIPFEKNKSEYSEEDVKPLYDSLNLSHFDITSIKIRAYSSLEGNVKRNTELQQERANSIVKALQSYQEPSMYTEITVSENWVDFLADITNTSFAWLGRLSKEEVREELKDRDLVEKLEPILQKHRKAVIFLELQKKDRYQSLAMKALVDMFSESIAEKNLEKAIELQNSIFEKIKKQEVPASFIDLLEIPRQSDYSILLNKQSVFKYLLNESDVYNTLRELNELRDLIPGDPHINYNICALKFKIWQLGESIINPTDFRKEIYDLAKYGTDTRLIKRMMINYEILRCEYYMKEYDYFHKDKSLSYIASNYKGISLSDEDYLYLAQFFASYSRYDWAIQLLFQKVTQIDVDEDLLFYYLNLTIIKDSMVRTQKYRSILLNAYNINPVRFCRLFNSQQTGGVTFQLLENKYLRDTYCENCQ